MKIAIFNDQQTAAIRTALRRRERELLRSLDREYDSERKKLLRYDLKNIHEAQDLLED